MTILKKFLLFTISAYSFVFTCLSLFGLTKFLSDFSLNSNSSGNASLLYLQDGDAVSYTIQATVIDVSLLCIFIIQHSSLLPLQDFLSTALHLPVLSRAFLNIFTSASLQLLIHFWKSIPHYTIWIINTEDPWKQLGFIIIHIFSWLLIYTMMLTMDITELLGIKQVYYHLTGRPTPSTLKSYKLQSLHDKIRHPSFLGFFFIFWTRPIMRLDRLLLAVIWSLYMLLVWRPGIKDYNYVRQQQITKRSVF